MVGVLRFEVTSDALGLGITETGDLEDNLGGCLGFDLERGAGEGVVLGQQVIGRLSEILEKR